MGIDLCGPEVQSFSALWGEKMSIHLEGLGPSRNLAAFETFARKVALSGIIGTALDSAPLGYSSRTCVRTYPRQGSS